MELYGTRRVASSINETSLAYIIERNGGQATITVYCIIYEKEDVEAHAQLLLFS